MNKTEFLKLAAIALLTTGLAAGCASDSKDEPAPAVEPVAQASGPSPAAKNAIYSAKIKLARAEKLGYAWRDTSKMIKNAEKAAAAGDNDKAIELANAASEQADDSIAQYHSESKRFTEQFGSVEASGAMGDSMSGSMSGSVKRGSSMDRSMDHSNRSNSMSSASQSMMVEQYTVETGDNLWNISAKDSIYGNPYQWPLIYKANSDQIKDADLIYSGQVFSIPGATGDEVDAAIQHAKTRGAWSIGEVEATDKEYLAR